MNLKQYMETQSFTEGFPQGDTIVDLEKAEFSDFEFTDDSGKKIKRTKIMVGDKEFYCPRSVLRDLGGISGKGGVRARVTRVGTTKDNTRYTVIEVKQ